jgi:hypothetical protein
MAVEMTGIIAHIGPWSADAGLALGQNRHCGVVGADALGGEDVVADHINERHQGCRGGANPICQRRDIEIDAFAFIDAALAIERQVQAVLGEQHIERAAWGLRARARSDARAPAQR